MTVRPLATGDATGVHRGNKIGFQSHIMRGDQRPSIRGCRIDDHGVLHGAIQGGEVRREKESFGGHLAGGGFIHHNSPLPGRVQCHHGQRMVVTREALHHLGKVRRAVLDNGHGAGRGRPNLVR